MAKRIYTDEMIEFLASEYKKHGLPVVARNFNDRFGMDKTPKQLKTVITRHGITCGRKTGALNKGQLRAYTDEQKKWTEEHYKQLSLPELTTQFNERFGTSKSENQIRSFTRNHKIHSGRSGHFKKGHKTWNKGIKGLTSANKTSFKKGQVPHNHRPVGSERITVDGYVEIKVAEPKKWEFKHRLVWQKTAGKVPPDHVVFHKDGDKQNNHPENLCLISRAELVRLNQLSRTDGLVYNELPDEIKPSVLLLAKVKAATFQAAKG